MFPIPDRRKGGAPQLGARRPGEVGPFGPYGSDSDDQDEAVPDLEAAVDARIQQLVADARARRQHRQEQRRALDTARQAGLMARHRAKLARLDDGQEPDDAA